MGLRKFRSGICVIVFLMMVITPLTCLNTVTTEQDRSNYNEKLSVNKDKMVEFYRSESNNINILDGIERTSLSSKIMMEHSELKLDDELMINSNPDNDEILSREFPSLFEPRSRGIELIYNPLNNEIIKKQNSVTIDAQNLPKGFTTTTNRQTGSRAEVSADLELWNIQWEVKHTGWCAVTDPTAANNQDDPENWYTGNQASTGSFKIGVTTKITVTVKNNGDTTINNVPVNLSVMDLIHDQPMRRSPETKYTTSIAPDQTGAVSYDFKPPYASTYVRISAEVDWPNDSDESNDDFSWTGIRICKWWDDLELSTAAWSHTAREELINGSSDDWHLTDSAFAQGDATHTSSNSWYEGDTDSPTGYLLDNYRNNNAQSLISPTIDLGNSVDERFWYFSSTVGSGDYTGYTFIEYHLTSINWLMTGITEENDQAADMDEYMETSDVLLTGDVSDDGGTNWEKRFTGVSGGRMGEITESEWYRTSYMAVYNDDETIIYYPGVPLNYNISDWSNVQFRHTFQADNDGNSEIGYYLDDFIIYGNDNYTVQKRLGISEVGYPKTNGIPIIYEGSSASFKVKVKNYGGPQSSIPVNMWVTDSNDETIDKYSKQNIIGSLATDDEAEVSFTFLPSTNEQGDYTIWLEASDQKTDWTPSDNLETIYVHVRAGVDKSDIDILVVDDDDSEGQLGMYRVNVEDKMLLALDDNAVEYRVYTVEYNETGPTADIMDDYALVIWLTGLDNADWGTNDKWPITLKEDDITELGKYLASGGKLWLISPGFVYDYYGLDYESIALADFANYYLRIVNCQANLTTWNNDNSEILTQGTPENLEGLDDTIMADAQYSTYNTIPPKAFTDIGGVIEKSDGDAKTEALFYQDTAHLQHNALFYKGTDYHAMTFAFNFYLISQRTDREDCVWRALIGFNMAGGVQLDLVSTADRSKTVYPDNSTTYQLKVTNTGKKPDTMVLSTEIIYAQGYPSNYKSWKVELEGSDVETESGNRIVKLNGLGTKNKIYLKVFAPAAEEFSEYPTAGSMIKVNVYAESQNTKLMNSTHCYAVVPSLGKITISCPDTDKTIEAGDTAEFRLELNNETNDVSDATIELSFTGSGEGLAKFYVDDVQSSKNKLTVFLGPNDENKDMSVKLLIGEHSLSGFYNLTVFVKDPSDDILHDSIELSTYVKQFYQVVCNTTGDDNGQVNFIIDPNDYKNDVDEYITKTFSINVRNFGNGYDKVSLNWQVNPDSDTMFNWPVPGIYFGPSSNPNNLTSISVKPYDETRTGAKYGEESMKFDVYIPLEQEIGTYIIDFVITSSGKKRLVRKNRKII